MKPNPLSRCQIKLPEFIASLQAVHDAAEAERVENAKLREQLSAAAANNMEETIKRMEAEKAALEAQNTALQVTTDAAKAAMLLQ